MNIMVQGEGKKFYKPDLTEISMTFSVNEKTYEKALEKGLKSVETFISDVLNKMNIERSELTTSRCSFLTLSYLEYI